MAWYKGVFSCGHEGRVNVVGREKDRQWKIDYAFGKMCEDCYQKHLEEEKERKLEEISVHAQINELPDLFGTPKQVDWAMSIRKKLFEQYEKGTFDLSKETDEINVKGVEKTFDFIIHQKKASFFIDSRDKNITELLGKYYKKVNLSLEDEIEKELEANAKIESTVYPKNKITNVPVEIVSDKEEVKAIFEKNSDFIEIVKKIGYHWNGEYWYKKINETTGSMEDRAAELGNKLLNAGFPVIILDQDVRKKAIDGAFEPECTRWVKSVVGTNKLVIKWCGFNDELYERSRTLPSAKWENGMTINVAHHNEVEEFADLYEFKFTDAALRLIKRHKANIRSSDPIEVAEIKEIKKDGLKEILESSDDILDDLKD